MDNPGLSLVLYQISEVFETFSDTTKAQNSPISLKRIISPPSPCKFHMVCQALYALSSNDD